jgi:hypothetical protein
MYLVPTIWTSVKPCGADSDGVINETVGLDSVLVAVLDATNVSADSPEEAVVDAAPVTSTVVVEDPLKSMFDVVVAESGVDDATCASAGLIINRPVRLRPTAIAKPTLGLIALSI